MAAMHPFAALRVHVMEPEKKGIFLSILYGGKLRSDAKEGSSHGEAKGPRAKDRELNSSFLTPQP